MDSATSSIKRCFLNHKWQYVGLVVLGVVVNLLDVGFALFLSWLVELPFGGDAVGFLLLIAVGVGYIGFQCLLNFLHSYLSRSFLAKMLLQWRGELWEGNLAQIDEAPDSVGRDLSKIIDETRLVCQKVLTPLLNFPTQCFAILAALAVSFVVNWFFGLMMLVSSPILFSAIFFFQPIIKKRLDAYVNTLRGYQNQTLDLLNSQEIAYSYHQQRFFRVRARKDSQALLSAELSLAKADAPFEALHNALSIGIRLMAAAAASLLVGLGIGAEWSLPACLFLASSLVCPLALLAAGLSDFLAGRSLLKGLVALPPKENVNPRYFSGFALHDARPANGVDLRVELAVKPGEKALLLGDPGSGKSTAIKMLAGLVQTAEGAVERPEGAGYCPQAPSVYPLDLPTNIALTDKPDASKLAKAKQFALIDFNLDDCSSLSGGEQKRIGLARAYYHADGYLLLDEPTTSLEKAGEAELYQSILSYPGAVLVSAHRIPLAIAKKFNSIYICSDHVLRKTGSDGPMISHYCLEGEV